MIPRRIFAGDLEILFLKQLTDLQWQVLYPAKKHKVGETFQLPGGVGAKLIEKGLPQIIEVTEHISSKYFFQHGELPLPPYIQSARKQRHQKQSDQDWYQTCYAKNEGSLASPTAGLHFKDKDFEFLLSRKVEILDVSLHVGLGTFLPIQTQYVSDFQIHSENFEVDASSFRKIQKEKTNILFASKYFKIDDLTRT